MLQSSASPQFRPSSTMVNCLQNHENKPLGCDVASQWSLSSTFIRLLPLRVPFSYRHCRASNLIHISWPFPVFIRGLYIAPSNTCKLPAGSSHPASRSADLSRLPGRPQGPTSSIDNQNAIPRRRSISNLPELSAGLASFCVQLKRCVRLQSSWLIVKRRLFERVL